MAQKKQKNKTNLKSLEDRKKAALWRWSHDIYQAARGACGTSSASYGDAIKTLKKTTQKLQSLHSKSKTIPGVARYVGRNTSPEFALLCWAKTLYDSALEACYKTKAYKGGAGNIQYAYHVVPILDQAVKDLKTLGGSQSPSATPTSVPGPTPIIMATPKPVLAAVGSSNCTDDQGCPDTSICVDGNCEPL